VTSIEMLTGESMPAGVSLRIHPSVASYVRATGEPWWTAGATFGDRIELAPLTVLERRGIFERTIRHELAHVITARALAGAPRWVREGAAVHFGDGPSPSLRQASDAAAGAIRCPDDDRYRDAGSVQALAALYEQAGRCFESALTRVSDWRLVR
jgi:hypothetical protein